MQFATHKYTGHLRHQQAHQQQQQQQQHNQQQEQQQQQQQQQTQQSTTTTTSTATQASDNSALTAGKQLLRSNGAPFKTIWEAEKIAKEMKKPILYLIHRTTCPSCKALIKAISRDKEFTEKTSNFVLADIEDDIDEQKADSYDVDGGYVPRVYFLDPEGEIISDIWNV